MTRTRAAAAVAIRIDAVILVLVCCCVGSTPARAMIDCMSAPGEPKVGARYFWREIDGRKCWFLRTGDIPPKSQLRWPAKTGPDARNTEPPKASSERAEPLAAESVSTESPPAESGSRAEPGPRAQPDFVSRSQLRFRTARVKPVATPQVNLGHGLDLMNGTSLTANTPPSLAPADPFHARFTGRSD